MKAFTIQQNGGAGELGTCDANEQNSAWQEGKFAVESAGLTTDASGAGNPDPNTQQLAEAINRYVGSGNFYVDSGAADAYVLTNIGTFKAITAYIDGMMIRFRALNANTGASTISVAGIGVKPLTLEGSGVLPANYITNTVDTIARYTSAAGGRFEVLQAAGTRVFTTSSVQGTFKNLSIITTGLDANVSVTADEIALEDTTFSYQTVRSVSLTINSAASGANGLDTGALAASTWYSVWVIYNPSTITTAGLISLSATTPTMPAGYTFKARVGWIRTDATVNKYPFPIIQKGRRVQYVPSGGTNLLSVRIMASGVAGNPTTPGWVAISVSTFVPTTASTITGSLLGGLGSKNVAAPNTTYGGYADTTKPPVVSSHNNAGTTPQSGQFTMIIEGTNNIYWASDSASSAITCVGWEDNI